MPEGTWKSLTHQKIVPRHFELAASGHVLGASQTIAHRSQDYTPHRGSILRPALAFLSIDLLVLIIR